LKALTCNELKSPASRPKPDRTLVKAWPAGYENCTFRVVDGGVLLSAKGMPTLFIQEGRLSDSKPSAKYKRMGRLRVYPTAEGVSGGSRDTLPSGSAPSLEESNKAIVDIINGPRRDRAMGLL
jgi:hypothetical protein